jgi:hypothetical protein
VKPSDELYGQLSNYCCLEKHSVICNSFLFVCVFVEIIVGVGNIMAPRK